ncbi:MAG: hypothetical protein KDA92_01055 [Planctomycetales bacterium]|nr:hypothetical protein [Planctomycetales bacterium]MCA9166830.1 hypothetical protein [Planctomycetales bacterium]
MRAALMGLLFGVVAMAWLGSGATTQTAQAQRNGVPGAGGEVIAIPLPGSDGQQIVVLVDPVQRSLASYQVDGKTAQVTLRCVRNFRWDLQLDDYFGTEPTPEKIQAMLQSR